MFFNISFVIVNNQRSILEEMKHLHLSILIVFLSIGMGFDAGAQSIVQSSNDVQSSKISLYPNPATDFFSIAPGEEKIKNISTLSTLFLFMKSNQKLNDYYHPVRELNQMELVTI